ncbi:hypothetical protein GCM10027418_21800 [Mariniluteicoccus endophyticus]
MQCRWQAAALGVAATILGGCSIIAGGSGQFVIEGRTYKVTGVTCTVENQQLDVRVRAGNALLELTLEEPAHETGRVLLGGFGTATYASESGEFEVVQEGNRFRVTGKARGLGGEAEGRTDEPFTADITCRTIKR